MANLDTTGKTAVVDATTRALSAPTLVGSNQITYTFDGIGVIATATFADDASGTLSDSANIGNDGIEQKVKSFTAQNCTVGAPSGTWSQAAFRFHSMRGTEAAPVVYPHAAAANNTNIKVVPGAKFRLRAGILRNTADTLTLAPQWYCAFNGGAQTAVTETFGATNIRLIGTSDTSSDIPNQGTATTNLLGAVGAGSFVAGTINRTAATIPSASIAPTNWIEVEGIFETDTDVSADDYHECQVYNNGVALDTYTVTPRATVIGAVASGGF